MAKKSESLEALMGEALVDFDNLGAWPQWSTGMPLVDIISGGLPKGRIVECYGPESSGKTTIFLRAAAQAQKDGYKTVYLDYENAMDPAWCEKLGIDVYHRNAKGERTFIVANPKHLQHGIGLIKDIITNHKDVALIILDSLAMAAPKQDFEDDVDAFGAVGLKARILSKQLPLIANTQAQEKSIATLCVVNQIREDIGGYNPTGQRRLTTPGGRGLKFAASLRIEFQKIGTESAEVMDEIEMKKEKRVVAHKIQATCTKNKTGVPFKRTKYFVREGVGIDVAGSIREIALSRGILKSRGAWYYIPAEYSVSGEEDKVNGKQALAEYFPDGSEQFKKLEEVVIAAISTSSVVEAEYEPDEEEEISGIMDLA